MNEGYYIIATGLILLTYFIVRAYYQRRFPDSRAKADDAESRRQKSTDSLVGAGQIPVLVYLLTDIINFAQIPVPDWMRWLGAFIALCGVGLFYWSHRLLGANWISSAALRKEHTLVTGGVYRLVRHPMYLATLILGIGVTLLTSNWFVGIGLIVPPMVMIGQRVPAEEEALAARFGDRYRNYAAQTGRFFPKISQ